MNNQTVLTAENARFAVAQMPISQISSFVIALAARATTASARIISTITLTAEINKSAKEKGDFL